MRTPLKRQCDTPAEAYERHRQEREADRKKLQQITQDSANVTDQQAATLSRLGDELQLRGIPVVGARGVGGAMHDTRPG